MPYQNTETLDRRVIASFREGLPDGASDVAALLIDQFLEEAASQADQLRAASQRGDAQALKAAAHNLRGSSTTMGANRLGALCTAVEAAAEPSPAPDAAAIITALMADLDRELVNVRAAMLAEREGASRA